MTKQWLGWLVQLSGIVVLGGLLLLAAQADVSSRSIHESSAGGDLTALAGCVVPATVGDPPTQAATMPETIPADCDGSSFDPLRSPLMTMC